MKRCKAALIIKHGCRLWLNSQSKMKKMKPCVWVQKSGRWWEHNDTSAQSPPNFKSCFNANFPRRGFTKLPDITCSSLASSFRREQAAVLCAVRYRKAAFPGCVLCSSLHRAQGQRSDPVNASDAVLHRIFSLLLLLFCSFPTLTHHLSYRSISSPGGPMFSQIPLLARSASALACSPTFVFLASSLCLVISVFSPPSSLSPRAGGGLSCPNNTNRSLRKEERGGRRRRRRRRGGGRKQTETKTRGQK